ncbi:MAG: VWA domain-containing protein, partial [Myxococcaceae bacterium]
MRKLSPIGWWALALAGFFAWAGCALKQSDRAAMEPASRPVRVEPPVAELPVLADPKASREDGRTQGPRNGRFPDMTFQRFGVNPTVETEEEPFSTFGVDVDTASYAMARSYLWRDTLPEEDAIRVEEFVNAFDYGYRPP